jgi:hypothetical protein
MKKILISALIIATSYTVSAQDTVFFQKPSLKQSSKKGRSSERTVIKLAPLNFVGGTIPLYVEREINQFLGLQLGAGVTTHNYLKDVFSSSDLSQPDIKSTKWNDGTSDTYNVSNSFYDYDHRKSTLGYTFSVEPRIYYANEGLEGNFVSLSFTQTRFNSDANRIMTGPVTSSEPTFTNNVFKEYENLSDIMVNFGSQTLYDHISLEYATGIGLRKLKGEKYAYSMDNGGNFVDGASNISKTKIAFNLSFKIGYHF